MLNKYKYIKKKVIMNIIIPLGGKGERFYKDGYIVPKPLIKVFNKEIIFHLLDNLQLHNNANSYKIFIIYHIDLDIHNFTHIIHSKYPQINLISIHYYTSGATETIYYGLNKIIELTTHKTCILLDCDTFYTQNILEIVNSQPENQRNMVFYTVKTHEIPIYSYIELDHTNTHEELSTQKIIDIREKEKISSNANTGCYVFEDINILKASCKYILDNNITFNGEPYTSCVIKYMLQSHNFYGYKLHSNCVFSLGTPLEVKQYINRTYAFLFDLDGTLVNTDEIYYDVWKTILLEYKIYLTHEIFKTHIHGNSDSKVCTTLIPHITANGNTNISNISILKDNLFIQSLDKIKLIENSVNFIKYLKSQGHLCSIVTNCNRIVAEKILQHIDLYTTIDFLTIGNECKNAKPFPDPYLETIQKYNIPSSKTIIFEDSKSGILSARLANPLCIVGITSNYFSSELLNLGVNICLDNYSNIITDPIQKKTPIQNIDIFIQHNNMSSNTLEKYIRQSLNLDIKQVHINEQKLKGGYISDVIALQITTHNPNHSINSNPILECVLKLENKHETKLSIMAKQLGLYERENYFYDAISKYINIKTPQFYGLIKDDELNTIGILMENLNKTGNYKLNLDLNNEDIDISLQVITALAKLHAKYWNKDINKAFPEIKKHNDPLFNPKWCNFINGNWDCFVKNWKNIMNEKQLTIIENIKNNFQNIQNNLSSNNLTLIHGDVKSPNIFYNVDDGLKPVFLDWQYVAIGKGIQDVIFFLIESFNLDKIKLNYHVFKNYYYQKLIQFGINNYSYSEYEQDIKDAVCYFPFFVAVWFGTTPEDDLIDKNFPNFFINKFLFFIEQIF